MTFVELADLMRKSVNLIELLQESLQAVREKLRDDSLMHMLIDDTEDEVINLRECFDEFVEEGERPIVLSDEVPPFNRDLPDSKA